jgi:tetratricopeptide (TPR) repeat protein
MGEFNKAKGYFQLLLSSLSFDHPDFGTIYNNLGILAHKQNQHKKAIDLFKQALEVLPEHHGDQASVYTNLGACYQALENYNDALNAYKKALEVNIFRGDKAKVYNNIGSIYRNLGQYEKSLKYYRKSLQLRHPDDPEYVALHINLALLYAQNWDYPNTLIHCQKSLESIQILPTDSILIGNTHLKAKIEQHSEAIAHFTDALFAYRQMTRSPLVTNAIVRALYEQGRSYMELDQDTNAFACFNEIFSLVFDDEHSQIHVALTHQSIGQIHESKGAFRHALLSYEKALQIWMILLEKNIKVDQHVIAQLLNDIGEVHYRKRRYWLALNYYNQAIEFAQ